MIIIKNREEIEKMRKAGKLAAQLLNYVEPFVKEGVSTLYLNDLCEEFTQKHGAISAPLNYHGFQKVFAHQSIMLCVMEFLQKKIFLKMVILQISMLP